MPLIQGFSRESIGANIATLRREGKAANVAAARAYDIARKVWKQRKPGERLPAYIREVNPMAAKKKRRTAAQKAATKKMLAGLKKYRAKTKKNPRKPLTAAEKKRRAKSKTYVGRASQATKKAPTKRLKKRRAANVAPGAYPNPYGKGEHANYMVVKLGANDKPVKGRKYFDGAGWCAQRGSAALWHDVKKAKQVAQAIADETGANVGILKESEPGRLK